MGWTEGASRTHGERGARAYNGGLGSCGKIYHFSLVFFKPLSKPKIVLGMDKTCELLALESFSDYCK